MSDVGTLIDYPMPVISTTSPNSMGIQLANYFRTLTLTSAWFSANAALFIPFTIGYIYTVSQMFWVNGSTVGTNHVDVGIYDAQGNQLVHSGSTLTTGVSVVQSVSLTSTILRPGQYYMGIVMDGTTDTILQDNAGGILQNLTRSAGILTQASAFPLPSTATLVLTTSAATPFVAVTSNLII